MTGGRFAHPDDEERMADEMARELEGLAATSTMPAIDDFADRVMAAVSAEPLPQPVRAFGIALTAGRLRAAAAAIGDAWRVTTSGYAPALVRAQAIALVLVVAIVSLGVVGGTTAAALGLLSPQPTPAPTLPPPSPLPAATSSPLPSPTPSDSAEPTQTAEPSETPEPSEDATAGATHGQRTPSPAATGTDDHGGGGSGSGSGSGGSGGDSGSVSFGSDSGGDSGDHGGATQTPEATSTDDHGGSSDG
jgi:negative regulator of sigma E activity